VSEAGAVPKAELHLHLLIHGRVQGVGYRAFLDAEARQRGLSGWTRNLRSGEVEAVVAGPAEAVEALIAACRGGAARQPSRRHRPQRSGAAAADGAVPGAGVGGVRRATCACG
jgi:acylphosphatase